TDHAMWPGKVPAGRAKPDVLAQACMKDCPVEGKLTSSLPPFARNAHGNLAEQNRPVGAQRGVDTTRPEGPPPSASPAAGAAPAKPAAGPQMPLDLLQKNSCTACHAVDRKVVGPSWGDVARKHAGKTEYIAGKIRSGGSGTWGTIPMPPQSISAEDAGRIAQWLAAGGTP